MKNFLINLIGIPLVLAAFVGISTLISTLPLGWELLALGVVGILCAAFGEFC